VSGETVSFTGSPSDWGLRRMVLHYAHLCAVAGGVDAFLIGTEMPGLTTIRSGASTYPAVTAFKTLAADVSSILGAGTKIGYAADWGFDLVHVAGEVVKRLYLTVGFAGVLILAALGATSTDGMIGRLGGVRWRALHRLAYAAGAIAVTHYVLQARLDVSGPMTMAGVFLWAMAARGVQRLDPDGRPGPAIWFALALLAAIVAGVGEVGFLSGIKSLPASRVLAANLSIDAGLRPAQMVLILGLSVALGAALRSAGPLARRRSRVRPA
jgi:hypothetical protein